MTPEAEAFASNLLAYNLTLAARVARGHGITAEEVAAVLRSLADAIETGDCAESMYPVSDGSTLVELIP
ncbi:MAG TPA: hypothetical protein VH136_18660 [Trebonia sp.]|jgi:hypothetical protein|nr:hypothetical protein [Trebonia sp.]